MKTKKEIDRDYYLRHREEVLSRVRSYYFTNKEDIGRYKKEWYQKRLQLLKERNKNYLDK